MLSMKLANQPVTFMSCVKMTEIQTTEVVKKDVSSLEGTTFKTKKRKLYWWGGKGAPRVPPVKSLKMVLTSLFLNQSFFSFFVHRKCFFDTELASLVFFHIPILLLQICNIIFFCCTTYQLLKTWNLNNSVQLYNNNNNNSCVKRSKNEHFTVIVKLFVIMGLTWYVLRLFNYTVRIRITDF